MPNYVSARIEVHGEHKHISEFIENSISKPDGTYEAICLGGLYTEYIRAVARLWDCDPDTLQGLRESLTADSTNIAFGFECAWGAPHDWLRDVSEKYSYLLFIMEEDSAENNCVGVTSYQAGVERYDESIDFIIPEFLGREVEGEVERPSQQEFDEATNLWEKYDADFTAISAWKESHAIEAAQRFWNQRKKWEEACPIA